MSKKKPQPARCDLPPLAVGTRVAIQRPNLWSGCAGEVVKYDPETTLHRIQITGRNGATFHADVMASEMEVDYAAMLEL